MSLSIQIYDHYESQQYIEWSKGQFENYTHTRERPGGMISCSFDIPEEYRRPFAWADVFNVVKVYHRSKPVWSGFIYGIERFWDKSDSGIHIDCVGWIAKFAMLSTDANLSTEKGSTFITDHVLAGELAEWIETGEVDTTDYEIPGTLRHKPRATLRQTLDEILDYNIDTHDFYCHDNAFYWSLKEEDISYTTNTKFSHGSLRQDLSEFSNDIRYSYRDTDGVTQTSYEEDTNSDYPVTKLIENYEQMTSAQAEQRAEQSLEYHEVLGATAEITIERVWNVNGGEIHPAEIEEGKIIRIDGLIPAKASPLEAFAVNDIDVFEIRSVTYDHENQVAHISPGRLPQTIPRAIAGK